jgi:4-hydroxybenzoate polyprenyltransferase
MLRTTRHILEMIRFSHTLFALPFALLAAVMAWATPLPQTVSAATTHHSPLTTHPPFHWQHLLGILLCMVAARSAAMAFNRLADRHIDAQNPRTCSRHLPAGVLSTTSVIIFTLISCLLFIAGTLLFLPNRWPLYLALPVLAFLLGYSYAKRFTRLAHFWLGAALMLAPVCAWIALRGDVLMACPADLLPPLLLGLAVFTWVAGFDMIYACQDADFDRAAGLSSIPAAIGVLAALRLAALCHLATLLLLAALPILSPQVPLGWLYGGGVACVALLLAYEHLLVRPDDLTRLNMAFFNVNAVISMGLFIVGTIDLVT